MKTAKKKTVKSQNDILDFLEKEKSGFFDLQNVEVCNHPEHKPPTHLYIPHGKGYRHVCPQCGHVTTIIPPQITF